MAVYYGDGGRHPAYYIGYFNSAVRQRQAVIVTIFCLSEKDVNFGWLATYL